MGYYKKIKTGALFGEKECLLQLGEFYIQKGRWCEAISIFKKLQDHKKIEWLEKLKDGQQ